MNISRRELKEMIMECVYDTFQDGKVSDFINGTAKDATQDFIDSNVNKYDKLSKCLDDPSLKAQLQGYDLIKTPDSDSMLVLRDDDSTEKNYEGCKVIAKNVSLYKLLYRGECRMLLAKAIHNMAVYIDENDDGSLYAGGQKEKRREDKKKYRGA